MSQPKRPRGAPVSEHRIGIKLVSTAPDGHLSIPELREWLGTLSAALAYFERSVTGATPRLSYEVVHLKQSSPMDCQVAAERPPAGTNDVRREVKQTFTATYQEIAKKKRIPAGCPDEVAGLLRFPKMREMQIPGGAGHRAMKLRSIDIDMGSDAAEDVVTSGSVSGRCESLNVHRDPPAFTLYPIIGAASVGCTASSDLRADIVAAADRYVTAYGRLVRRSGARFPHECRVERLEIHARENDLPPIEEGFGSAPECTGDLTSEESIGGLRDEWRER